jgi:hypothetical protein
LDMIQYIEHYLKSENDETNKSNFNKPFRDRYKI